MKRKTRRIIAWSWGVVSMLAVLGWLFWPFSTASYRTPPGKRCADNLMRIDAAKESWAFENKKAIGAVVSVQVVNDIIRKPLVCPRAGTYEHRMVGESPICSFHGALDEDGGIRGVCDIDAQVVRKENNAKAVRDLGSAAAIIFLVSVIPAFVIMKT